MVAEPRATLAADDPITALALLLDQWRLKPSRDARWLHKLCVTFYEQQPAAWARYARVAALASDLVSFLGLPEWNAAAVRASAFLAALARVAPAPRPTPVGKRPEWAAWEAKLRTWRWLQIATSVLHGLRPGYDDSQPLSRRGKVPPIESRVLALAEDFDELTRDWRGAPKARIPQALKALRGPGYKHDPKLVDWLWSEEGQEACDRVLRTQPAPDRQALAALRASLRLLDRGRPPHPVARRPEPTAQVDKPRVAPTLTNEEVAVTEDEGREEMTKTASKEEWAIPVRSEAAPPTATEEQTSLGGRIATVVRELEQIKLAATRSQEALASILPAMEELSAVVSRLQASLQLVQTGPAPARVSPDGGLRPVEVRVERPQGTLDATEVVDALESVRDLRDLRVRERGTSWALLGARVDEETDPVILEAKVTGSLSRRFAGDEDEPLRVDVTLCE